MTNGLELVTFADSDIRRLYEAFIRAFSGNDVTFRPSFEQFQHRILHKLNLSADLSGLMLVDQQVIAFVLHAVISEKGKTTAYNGGTGVVPEYRGKGYSAQIYDWLIPKLKKRGVNNILLEVIEGNQSAIRLYQSLGFQFARKLKCYIIHEPPKSSDLKTGFTMLESLDWKSTYEEMESYETAFLDRVSLLKKNLNSERILEGWLNGNLCGYVVFQPSLGRVSRIAVHRKYRQKGLGTALIKAVWDQSSNGQVTVMNVSEDEFETIEALERMGFKNEIDQFEMELII